MKKIIMLSLIIAGTMINNAHAAGYGTPDKAVCCSADEWLEDDGIPATCNQWRCGYAPPMKTFVHCSECPKGYTMSEKSLYVCDQWITYYECEGGSVSPQICMAGQYKDSDGNCQDCPSDEYGNAAMSSKAASAITDCYIASGSPFSDESGSGTYASNCPWTGDDGDSGLPVDPGEPIAPGGKLDL